MLSRCHIVCSRFHLSIGWIVASHNRRKRKFTSMLYFLCAHTHIWSQVLKKLAHFNRPFKYIGQLPLLLRLVHLY
jgi:hypothetical protein